MEIGERRHANILILRPVGRIDSLNYREFQDRLLTAVGSGTRECVIDLGAVEFVSTAGLRAVLTAVRSKPESVRLALAGANEVVAEILKIARFSHILPIYASVGAAAAALLMPAAQPAPLPAAPSATADGRGGSLALRFWGTRGSLPAPLEAQAVRAKIRAAVVAALAQNPAEQQIDAFIDTVLPFSVSGTYGGNTSCVEIGAGEEDCVLCDAGTGMRAFGRAALAEPQGQRPRRYHLFLSHLHWDHTIGFPFFAPARLAGTRIFVYGCHDGMEEALRRQQAPPSFPVDFAVFPAEIEFVRLEPGRSYEIAGFAVTALRQSHAGDSYGYRFTRDGKTIVYSVDGEHKSAQLDADYPFVDFYRDADVLIFDAMYSLADQISIAEDTGHSNNVVAVELAQMARVRRLVLCNHEPACDDAMIEQVLAEAIRYQHLAGRSHRVEILAAYDGLELTL